VHVVDVGLLPPWHASIKQATAALIARGGQALAARGDQDLRALVVAGCCGDEAWVTQKLNLMYVALTRAKKRLVLCDKVAAWLKPLGLELKSAAEGQSEQKRRRTTVSVFGQVKDTGDHGKGEG